MKLPDKPGEKLELVNGELRVGEVSGVEHAQIQARVIIALAAWAADDRADGVIGCCASLVVRRSRATVIETDAGWLDAERLARKRISGALDGAPNLVVEIVSPSDRWSDVIQKVGRWLKGGAELVWVIDPATRSVAVHSADGQTQTFGERDTLEGGEVLKGLRATVRDLFPKQK